MKFKNRFCHHTRTNFLKFKVKKGPQTFAEIFGKFQQKFGVPFSPFHLKFQIVSLGVMTVIVLKTCIINKKFQTSRQVFQTLFRKPKIKQHRASQLVDLSFETKFGNFRNSCPTRRAKKSQEEPRVALASTSSNVLQQ